MKIIADSHVHLYPCYKIGLTLTTLLHNLEKLSPNTIKTAFLVERSDCNFFSDIRENEDRLIKAGSELTLRKQKGVISVMVKGDTCLSIFPGRQIVTSERIEILSLTLDDRIKDGLPADTVVNQIIDRGGVPVISWAPGKWFFERGKLIEKLIDGMNPESVLIGDTSLRPTIWRKPLLMKKAERAGYKIIAGSDPLPFAGEELNLGTYGSLINGSLDSEVPIESIRSLLTNPDIEIKSIGRRNSMIAATRRVLNNAKTKERFD